MTPRFSGHAAKGALAGVGFAVGLCNSVAYADDGASLRQSFASFGTEPAEELEKNVLGTVETLWDDNAISLRATPPDILDLSFMPPLPKGWSASVDVALDEAAGEEAVSNTPAFADGLDAKDSVEMISGFYTMRYDFKSDTSFRPYAGAGIGLVSVGDQAERRDSIAGRALAGFNVALDEDAAFFAEYAFMKSGGSPDYAGGARSAIELPDDAHSLKIGFRRSF